MAGHSKWANIKHRKERQDAKKGKIFTKLIRELTVAARQGGGVPADNPRLRLAVDKALTANMTRDTIDRAIARGVGSNDADNMVELSYEGYAPSGVAIIVEAMTDNRNRTAAEVRHAFSKCGGNLGTDGSVAFMFKHCGQMLFAPGTSEDAVMEAALDAGAEDVITDEEGTIEVLTGPAELSAVRAALEAKGLKPELAEVTMRADTNTELAGDDGAKMQKLLDALEGLDDVQEVYSNAVIV